MASILEWAGHQKSAMPTSPSNSIAVDTAVPGLWALIPCAGTGSRSGAIGPKQYQDVDGKAMVLHTIAAFSAVQRLRGVLVVVSQGDGFFDSAIAEVQVAHCGGATRAQTVSNGLQALLKQGAQLGDWVLVHDAARCLITPAQIDTLIDACLADAVGGLLALPLPDTLKQAVQVRVGATLERADKWLAQTPQMFRLGELADALQAAGDAVTDESSAMEFVGKSPLLVRGSAQNFKVTYPEDFTLAQALLQSRRLTET
jgi:2-C-methyl-D-erythritol 4-phosphate cytidylyltransferase